MPPHFKVLPGQWLRAFWVVVGVAARACAARALRVCVIAIHMLPPKFVNVLIDH